jgi:type I restriction enzyme S subunit
MNNFHEVSSGNPHPSLLILKFGKARIILPPLAEQHRIVAKVDELMTLCDQLEERQIQRNTTRKALQVSALDALANAETPDELASAWKRVRSHWDVVTAQPDCIGTLRQVILQLAVQGKLVPQDLDDEPASVIIDQITSEKCEDIGRQKRLPLTSDEPAPFDIPNSWGFAPLVDLCRFIDYRGKTPPKTDSGVRLITAKNIREGFIKDDPREYVSHATYDEFMTRGFPRNGDVLFTTEAPLGNAALVEIDEEFALAQRVINLQPRFGLFGRFLMFGLLSPPLQDIIREKATGTTATGIKAARLKQIHFPVPPEPEQHRIVAKVDELMAICNELEERLQAQQDTASELASASVYALAG